MRKRLEYDIEGNPIQTGIGFVTSTVTTTADGSWVQANKPDPNAVEAEITGAGDYFVGENNTAVGFPGSEVKDVFVGCSRMNQIFIKADAVITIYIKWIIL